MKSDTSDPLPVTEQENPNTANISSLPTAEVLRLMNDEDRTVAEAVKMVLGEIESAVEAIVVRLKKGGRVFYIGTGTSGRLGVLDASEIPPTFGVSPGIIQGVIAGGYEACHQAVEASEDDASAGARDLQARGFSEKDVLVGIAASGKTPYTVGAISAARELGAQTISVTCVPDSPITKAAEINIVPVVGAEVVAGSTRLKSGTAQKLVLNMLSTATMIKLGHVIGNRMVNVQTRNEKLRARALRIIKAETGLDASSASSALDSAEGNLSAALVMLKTGATYGAAQEALANSSGAIEKAVNRLKAS